MIEVTSENYRDLKQSLANFSNRHGLGLWWLGQAGFVLKHGQSLVVIDPYLSDFLAKKYRGQEYPHIRMRPPPIAVESFPEVDWVLVSHRHSDHMDPETLVPLAGKGSGRFIVPRAERDWAVGLGLPEGRVIGLNTGEEHPITPAGKVTAIASAHEELKTNERGEHHFLGYIVDLGAIRLYHAGDCVPYPGLASRLRRLSVDLALLPINGRDEARRSRNVPGNFSLAEAVEICDRAGIRLLMGHHFGMFDFNTIDPGRARQDLTAISHKCTVLLAEPGQRYTVKRT